VALHYTQSQLAHPDFSVSYISAIERGQIHPSLRALEILAGRLGLSSTELLPKRPQQNNQQVSATPPQPEREEDEGDTLLLEVQLRLAQNDSKKAIELLTRTSPKRMKRLQQLWHSYLFGRAHLLAGHFVESEHIFSSMVQVVKDANNLYLHTHVQALLGDTLVAQGKTKEAILAYQRCLNTLEDAEVRNAFLIATVTAKLGAQYAELQEFDETMNMFRQALSVAEEWNTLSKAYVILNTLIQYAISKEDYYAFELYAYQSMLFSAQDARRQEGEELYHYLGQTLMKGDAEEAFSRLKALEERGVSQPLLQANLAARFADWYFNRQDVEKARHYAEEAYRLSQSFGETVTGADASIVLGRIEYAQQDFERGDEHFVQGLAMMERLQRREEVTEQSMQYARLLEARGKEREAFTYFRRAFQNKM
jgi:tetratricopeptide (TPR) repeat protein